MALNEAVHGLEQVRIQCHADFDTVHATHCSIFSRIERRSTGSSYLIHVLVESDETGFISFDEVNYARFSHWPRADANRATPASQRRVLPPGID